LDWAVVCKSRQTFIKKKKRKYDQKLTHREKKKKLGVTGKERGGGEIDNSPNKPRSLNFKDKKAIQEERVEKKGKKNVMGTVSFLINDGSGCLEGVFSGKSKSKPTKETQGPSMGPGNIVKSRNKGDPRKRGEAYVNK